MCQSTAYLISGDEKKVLMEDVSQVKPDDGEVLLVGLLGEEKRVKARLKELLLDDHQIILEEL